MTVELMGIRIDDYTFDESIKKGIELVCSDGVKQVITINAEMFKEATSNKEFKKIIDEAEIVIPDGVGVKIALKLKGKEVQRIAGIDFAKQMLIESVKNNIPVAIIGSKKEVVTKAVENLKSELNGINIVYYHDGYFKDDDLIYNELKEVNPKLVLVALGSPKQEYFIYKAKLILSPCLMVGIGGSLDVWSGTIQRAPKIYQKLGLEWLYRTIKQPERFKRIFPTLPLFILKAITYKED